MRSATVVVLTLGLALGGLPAVANENPTVGEFVQEIARTLEFDAIDAGIATRSLRDAGLRIPVELDLTATLTEADVARISRAAGLHVTTRRPDAPFDAQRVDRYLTTFRGELRWLHAVRDENPGQGEGPGNGNGNGPPFDPFTKGQGQSKGKGKGSQTPSSPD